MGFGAYGGSDACLQTPLTPFFGNKGMSLN